MDLYLYAHSEWNSSKIGRFRIASLLSAEKETAEPAGSEAAKFRLWVKSKGLQLAPTQGQFHQIFCIEKQEGKPQLVFNWRAVKSHPPQSLMAVGIFFIKLKKTFFS